MKVTITILQLILYYSDKAVTGFKQVSNLHCLLNKLKISYYTKSKGIKSHLI